MASKDVLEMWDAWIESANEDLDIVMDLAEALAAEVRELRKDRERLDWLLSGGAMQIAVDGVWITRPKLDAAMGEAKGE